jgi:molybdenum-dependent DNA-binding transcriptional regulator ModE
MMRVKRRTRGDERLLSALAAGSSVEQAARTAGVSERTAYRRLGDPAFRSRLASVRDELVAEALGELAGSASEAVATLRRLLAAGSEHVQLGAARVLLDQLLRLREAVELAERVSALERRLERQRRGR